MYVMLLQKFLLTNTRLSLISRKWLEIAKAFEEKWQFPNCFATMDGKHLTSFHSIHSGSTYYNYKGFRSVVLLALVDAISICRQVCICQQWLSRSFKWWDRFMKCIDLQSHDHKFSNFLDPSPPPHLSNANESFLIDSQRQDSLPHVFIIYSFIYSIIYLFIYLFIYSLFNVDIKCHWHWLNAIVNRFSEWNLERVLTF